MNKELTIVQKTANQTGALIEQAKGFEITTTNEQTLAEDLLKGGKKLKEAINEHYDSFLNPLKLQIKEKETERKGIVGKIDEAIELLRNKLTGWLDKEKARKLTEAAAQDAEDLLKLKKEQAKVVKKLVKEGSIEEAQQVAEEALPVIHNVVEATETGDGIYTASRLKYEIEDIDKVPDNFFKPRQIDTKKVWAAGYAGKKIAGIKFYREDNVVVKV